MDRHERGHWAERIVAAWLRWRGWRIVARNWHGGGGELDIVASRWQTLLVVEVRFRTLGDPLLTIDPLKLERVQRAARALVQAHRLQRYRLRIDLVGVDGDGRIERQRDVGQR